MVPKEELVFAEDGGDKRRRAQGGHHHHDRSKRTSIHNISALVANNKGGVNASTGHNQHHKGTTAVSMATNRSQYNISSTSSTQI